MILKASQRAGGKQLALHLLRLDENDHVEVHELRGFVAGDLIGAFSEAYAISRATKCRQFLFSLSLNPPEGLILSPDDFGRAADAVEKRLGLEGHQRALVLHEKRGRRHAHCVWSRINAKTMKAINLPHFKYKLQELSQELYIEHGCEIPAGFLKVEERNPLNFTREEWQQAKRINRDPKTIKAIFQSCWSRSDSSLAFASALEAHGYYLAQGTSRGYVATDHTGEVYAIARWVGVRTKEVRAKLGDSELLPAVEKVQRELKERISEKLARFRAEVKMQFEQAQFGLQEQRRKLVEWQRHERHLHKEVLTVRAMEEARVRSERFRTGLRGIWDWITGRRAQIKRQSEAELEIAKKRDAMEHQKLVDKQLEERRRLQRLIRETEVRLDVELASLGSNKQQHVSAHERNFDQTRIARRRRDRSIRPHL